MQHINVIICRVGDPPCLPNIRPLGEGEIQHIVILERGMESGATSISFQIYVPVLGKFVFAQMSAGMYQTVSSAIAGAEERFKGK